MYIKTICPNCLRTNTLGGEEWNACPNCKCEWDERRRKCEKVTVKTIEFLKTARVDAQRQAAFAHKCCVEARGNRRNVEAYVKRRAFWNGYSIALRDVLREIKQGVENENDKD